MSSSSQPPNNGYITIDAGYDVCMRKVRNSLYKKEKETGVIPPIYDDNLHRQYLEIGSDFIPDRASLVKYSSLQLSENDISDEEKQKNKAINEVEKSYQAHMSSNIALILMEFEIEDFKKKKEMFQIDIAALKEKPLLTSEEEEKLFSYESSIKVCNLNIMNYTSLHKYLTEDIKKNPIKMTSEESTKIWIDHKKNGFDLFLKDNQDIKPPQDAPISKYVTSTNSATTSKGQTTLVVPTNSATTSKGLNTLVMPTNNATTSNEKMKLQMEYNTYIKNQKIRNLPPLSWPEWYQRLETKYDYGNSNHELNLRRLRKTNYQEASNLETGIGFPMPKSGGKKTYTKKTKGGVDLLSTVSTIAATVYSTFAASPPAVAVTSAFATIAAVSPTTSMEYAASMLPSQGTASNTSQINQAVTQARETTAAMLQKLVTDAGEREAAAIKNYKNLLRNHENKYGEIKITLKNSKRTAHPKNTKDKIEVESLNNIVKASISMNSAIKQTQVARRNLISMTSTVNTISSPSKAANTAANSTATSKAANTAANSTATSKAANTAANSTATSKAANTAANSTAVEIIEESHERIEKAFAEAEEQAQQAPETLFDQAQERVQSRAEEIPTGRSYEGMPLQTNNVARKTLRNSHAAYTQKFRKQLAQYNHEQLPTTNFGMNVFMKDPKDFVNAYGKVLPIAPTNLFGQLAFPPVEGFLTPDLSTNYKGYKSNYNKFISNLKIQHKELYSLIQYRSISNILESIRYAAMTSTASRPLIPANSIELRDSAEMKPFITMIANKQLKNVKLHIHSISKRVEWYHISKTDLNMIDEVILMGTDESGGKAIAYHAILKQHELDDYLIPLLVRFIWPVDKLPSVGDMISELEMMSDLPVSLSGFYRSIGGLSNIDINDLEYRELALVRPILDYNKIRLDLLYQTKLQKTFNTLSKIRDGAGYSVSERNAAYQVQVYAVTAMKTREVFQGDDIVVAVQEQLEPLKKAIYMLSVKETERAVAEQKWESTKESLANLTFSVGRGALKAAQSAARVIETTGDATLKLSDAYEFAVKLMRVEIIAILTLFLINQHPDIFDKDTTSDGAMSSISNFFGELFNTVNIGRGIKVGGTALIGASAIIIGEKTMETLGIPNHNMITSAFAPLIYHLVTKSSILRSKKSTIQENLDAGSSANVAADVKEKVVEAKLAAQPSAALNALAAAGLKAMAQSPQEKVSSKVKAAIKQTSAAAAAHPEAQPSAALNALAAAGLKAMAQSPQKKVSSKVKAAIKQTSAAAAEQEPEPEPEPEPKAVAKSPSKKELAAAMLQGFKKPQSAAAPEHDMFSVAPLSTNSKAFTPPPPPLNPIPSPAASPVGVKQVLKGMIGHTQKDGLPIYPTGPAAASPSPITNLLKTAELKALAKKTAKGGRRTKKRIYKKFRSTRKRDHRR